MQNAKEKFEHLKAKVKKEENMKTLFANITNKAKNTKKDDWQQGDENTDCRGKQKINKRSRKTWRNKYNIMNWIIKTIKPKTEDIIQQNNVKIERKHILEKKEK